MSSNIGVVGDDDDDGIIDSGSETRARTHFSTALKYGSLYVGGHICACPMTGWIAANAGHSINFISIERCVCERESVCV